MLPWVYGSGPAPEALRGEDDDGVLNTAADHDVMVSVVGADSQHQQQVWYHITKDIYYLSHNNYSSEW